MLRDMFLSGSLFDRNEVSVTDISLRGHAGVDGGLLYRSDTRGGYGGGLGFVLG